MDVLDIRDKLHEVSRCITCLGALLSDRVRIPARGSDLATLLTLVQREIEGLERRLEPEPRVVH